jgi:hypothetical protein
MPFLNDPSRIMKRKHSQLELQLQGGVKTKRIMSYMFSADNNFNKNYHSSIIDKILQDEEHWKPLHIKFVPFWSSSVQNNRVQRKPDVYIHLSNEQTIKSRCGFEGLSCATVGGHEIYLNEQNWTKGSSKSGLSLDAYRRYVLTHEMCHILGYLHEECSGDGNKVSIMQQQTLGHGKCVPNDGKLIFNSGLPPKIKTQWD